MPDGTHDIHYGGTAGNARVAQLIAMTGQSTSATPYNVNQAQWAPKCPPHLLDLRNAQVDMICKGTNNKAIVFGQYNNCDYILM